MEAKATILGIDPGMSCGWAVYCGRIGTTYSGTWNLRGGRFDSAGMRIIRLVSFLDDLHARMPVDLVVFEEVRRHMGTDAAHVYGAIVGRIQEWCERQSPKIASCGIPVGTVKKLATGRGNADKTAMLEAARGRWKSQNIVDDNQADALWIMECGVQGIV